MCVRYDQVGVSRDGVKVRRLGLQRGYIVGIVVVNWRGVVVFKRVGVG